MLATATLNAHHLARLIRATMPHIAPEGMGLDRIDGIRFDSDHTTLHTVATDQHTLAAARARLTPPGEPFARTVHGKDLPTLRAWVDAHLEMPPYGEAVITLTAAPGHLTFEGPRGTLRVPADDERYPDWRQLLNSTLNDAPSDARSTAWTSKLWERWQHANRTVRTWHRAPDKALVILGTDVIGLQLPRLRRGPDTDRSGTPADALADWTASLGTDTGARVELADAMEAPVRPLYTSPCTIPDMTEDLLRQTLTPSPDRSNTSTDGPGAVTAARAGIGAAWAAYRLLQALTRTDPDLAADIVAGLGDELDSDEIAEWAWQAAVDAGHDPKKWAEERAQALIEQSGKTGGTAAGV
ncbi:hypothetical protein ACWDBO_30225 [Streptomyces mirabilis]|uniref:hypothetical protein n=1 Tax=Streptomyces mirabilis TaxID=68239 RepID=UPI00332FF28F